MSNILITGVASGFGRLTTQALLKAGHRVAGSMRDLESRNRANAEALVAMGCHVVELDVTDDASTTGGVSHALRQLGSIDVVINNAGIGALGLQEGFTPDDWRNVFEINVFGVQRVARAVLPHMRERGQGLLIQISSLTGRFPFPFQGPYCASKWAAEALADLYRLELAPSGVESCIVEPGGFPTEFLNHLTAPSDMSRLASYGEMGRLPAQMLAGFESVFAANPAQTPQIVADAIVELIEKPKGERPFRTVVDRMGLGELVDPYNEHLEKITTEMCTLLGMGHLLKVRT